MNKFPMEYNQKKVKQMKNKLFIRHPKFFFYIFAYTMLSFMSSCSGLGYEDHTTSYPEPGECMIVKSDMYYYNAIAHGEYPCLLGFEGLGGVIWTTFIISFFFFWALRVLRKKSGGGNALVHFRNG